MHEDVYRSNFVCARVLQRLACEARVKERMLYSRSTLENVIQLYKLAAWNCMKVRWMTKRFVHYSIYSQAKARYAPEVCDHNWTCDGCGAHTLVHTHTWNDKVHGYTISFVRVWWSKSTQETGRNASKCSCIITLFKRCGLQQSSCELSANQSYGDVRET